MLLESKLLINGCFLPEDVNLFIKNSPLKFYKPELKTKLELLWQDKLLDAKQNNYSIWNSQSYALKDTEIIDNKLRLTIGLVEYKYQTGIIQLIETGELSNAFATRLMYSSLLIQTSDQKWVFGIGASHVFVGETKFIGGSYSQDEHLLSDGNSLFTVALSELEEELGITKDKVRSMSLCRIYATPRGMRSFVFMVNLNIDTKTVKHIFKSRKDEELSDILILETKEARYMVSQLENPRKLLVDLI